jgi:UDP-GlcNAc:undecaprenyl-phosphate GlcNAc-1-phosphate transferase
LFLNTLPLVVLVKLVAFLTAGVYRGIWRYASLSTVIDFSRAVAIGCVSTILVIVLAFRFEAFSRTVFVLDSLILLIAVTGSRFTFRLLRGLFPGHVGSSIPVVIYGAGDGGELVYRELLNNPSLHYVPVAFVDDDASKAGRLIHGVRVYSPAASLAEICRKLGAKEVLISTTKITKERLTAIIGECAAAGLLTRRACMSFEPLQPADFGWVMADPSEQSAAVPLISRRAETTLVHDFARLSVDN